MRTYPFAEVVEALLKRRLEGWDYLIQFNCSKCHKKQTCPIPNEVHERYVCSECGTTTDITRSGCNYALMRGGPVEDALMELRRRR